MSLAMKRQYVLSIHVLIGIVASAVFSCGKNEGSQQPNLGRFPNTIDADRETDGSRKQLSERGYWRADIYWSEKPTFDPELIKSLRGVVRFWSVDGREVSKIDNASVQMVLPKNGISTGSLKPKVSAYLGRNDQIAIENIFLSKSGAWQLQLKARVEDSYDLWILEVAVP